MGKRTHSLAFVAFGLVPADVLEGGDADDVCEVSIDDVEDVEIPHPAGALVLVEDLMGYGAVVGKDVANLDAAARMGCNESAGEWYLDASLVAPCLVVRMDEVPERPVRAVEGTASDRDPGVRDRSDDTCFVRARCTRSRMPPSRQRSSALGTRMTCMSPEATTRARSAVSPLHEHERRCPSTPPFLRPKFGKPVKQGGKHGCGTPSPPQTPEGQMVAGLLSLRRSDRTSARASSRRLRGDRGSSTSGIVADDHSTVEIDLTGGDLIPRPRAAELDPLRTTPGVIGRVGDERCDPFAEFRDCPDLGENRRLARNLGYRTARVAGDNRTARLGLDNHSPELLDPRRRRAARYEHDMRSAVDVGELRRRSPREQIESIGEPEGCSAGSRRGRLGTATDDDEPRGTRSVHACENLDSVHDTLLGHQAAEEAEHELVVVERLVSRMEDRVVVAERQHVDQSREPLPRATEAACPLHG